MQRSSRDEVLDAVRGCVLDHGVRRTTMVEVARRAGMSRSTLYTHFADVDEATAALLTRELLGLLDATAASPDAADPARVRLVRQAVRLVATVPDRPLVARILELDGELLVPYLVHRLGSSQRAILATVTDLVVEGQGDGSIRDGMPATIAFSTFLVAQAFVVSARIGEVEHGREALLRELEQVLDQSLRPQQP